MASSTQPTSASKSTNQKVDGPAFCRLLLSHRSLYRADNREHHVLVDDQTGVRYFIDRTSYLTYLQSRNR